MNEELNSTIEELCKDAAAALGMIQASLAGDYNGETDKAIKCFVITHYAQQLESIGQCMQQLHGCSEEAHGRVVAVLLKDKDYMPF